MAVFEGTNPGNVAAKSPAAPAGGSGWLKRVSGEIRTIGLWAVGVGVGLGATIVVGLHVRLLRAPLDTDVAWWLVVLAFYASEWLVVDRRREPEHHRLSMATVPLVVGLFTLPPLGLMVAQILAATGYALSRKDTPVGRLLMVSRRGLQVAIALVVFDVTAMSPELLGPAGWFSALIAALASFIAGLTLAFLLSWISGRPIPTTEMRELVTFGSVVVISNAGLGTLVVHVLLVDIRMLSFAIFPAVVLYAAYRSHAASRRERMRLQQLYAITRDLHEAVHVDTALVAAARHAREMFDAEFCEIIFALNSDSRAFATRVGRGAIEASMEHVDVDLLEALLGEGESEPGPRLVQPGDASEPYWQDQPSEIQSAMTVPIERDDSSSGIVIVANPMGKTDRFDKTDLNMLGALAGQVGVAIQRGQLEHSLEQLTQLKEKLQHQANHDELTGLANRVLFRERVKRALEESRRTDSHIAVMFLDIDDFKAINDSLGHPAGDKLLQTVAERLRQLWGPAVTIARLGSDEFGILHWITEKEEDATQLARQVLAELAAPVEIEGRSVAMHVSIGVTLGRHGDAVDGILRDADLAMYAAKRGKNRRIEVFQTGMRAHVLAHFQLRNDLGMALTREELRLRYQPIVDLRTGKLAGFEALLRWKHPEQGLLSPDSFVMLAEETGRIHAIGRWVIWEALRRSREWESLLRGSGTPLAIAVNLSAKQLESAELAEHVETALRSLRVEPSNLILEITETTLMGAAPERLDELRRLGVRLAIDDFGTGYSSFGSLHQMPVDILKVDRLFVEGLGVDRESESDGAPFIDTMVGLAQVLGLETIAEGIETEDQLRLVRELGCPLGQGFLFAKPLHREEAADLVYHHALGRSVIESRAKVESGARPQLRAI